MDRFSLQEQNIADNYIKQNDVTYSVTEVSLILKQFIETSFKDIVIRGEISGIKRATSGHIYFSLKDKNAVLNAICWRNTAAKLPLHMEDGMEVICYGSINTYPARSNYQIIIQNIKLAGEGVLLAMLEKRREKLRKEGLFDEKHKKHLPIFPQNIGIITSLHGAVIKDILHRLEDRFPIQVVIWDVIVQGSEASGYIVEAIEGFNNLPKHISSPDVIIIARGGGSIEDLWSFNEEIVIRAVYNSKIPIISAIGHETDNTLIDLVSDLRAPTPTAAVEFATPNRTDIKYKLEKIKSSLNSILPTFINLKQAALKSISTQLNQTVLRLDNLEIILNNLKVSLKSNFDNIYKTCSLRLSSLNLSSLILIRLLELNKEKLHNNSWKLKKIYISKLEDISNWLHSSKKLLESYNYKNVLKRGFTIVRDSKKEIIRSSQSVSKTQLVQIEFHDGKMDAKVYKNNIKAQDKDVKSDLP